MKNFLELTIYIVHIQTSFNFRCLVYNNKLEISSLAIHHETKFETKYNRGKIVNAWASCEPQTQNEPNYQLVVLFQDGSISSVTPLGNLMWLVV